MMKNSKIADVSLLFVAFIWGSTFVLVQNAISFIEPFTFNAIRFGIAAIFLLIWLLVFHKDLLKLWNMQIVKTGITLGIWLFSAYALQTFGLLYTTSSKSGFITGLSVVLVPIFAYFILKHRPKSFAILGVAIATIGLYFLTLGDNIRVNYGDILTFFCAISFAAHIVLTSKYTTKYSTFLLTITQISTVTLLSAISSLVFENWTVAFSSEIIRSFDVWIALFITSIFATALAFLAQTNFQKFTTPTRVALIFAMEPVFAALTAVLFAGERLGFQALIGCLFIFIGMILAEVPSHTFLRIRKKTRKQESC